MLVASLVALAAAIGVMFWERHSPHPPSPTPSGIAVLPFENLSADPENASFTDGVQRNPERPGENLRLEGHQPNVGDAIQDRRETQPAPDSE